MALKHTLLRTRWTLNCFESAVNSLLHGAFTDLNSEAKYEKSSR